MDALLALNKPVSYCNVESLCGHDAFLLPNDLASYGGMVAGFLANRLNVSVTGLEASSGVRYFPSWMEVAVTLSVVAGGFLLFRLAVRHLYVWGRPAVCAR